MCEWGGSECVHCVCHANCTVSVLYSIISSSIQLLVQDLEGACTTAFVAMVKVSINILYTVCVILE